MKNNILFSILIIFLTACGGVTQSSQETLRNNTEQTTQNSTAKALYKDCAGCHGANGEVTALGKSDIIGGQSTSTTIYQLQEYRARRLNQYGLGSVMIGQSQLSDDQINLLSEYISTLSGITKDQINNTQGKELYKKCIGCHGQQGEKVAIGESLIIQNMSKFQILTALKGYKNKTYGRTNLKEIMTLQVKNFTEYELEILANYISKL